MTGKSILSCPSVIRLAECTISRHQAAAITLGRALKCELLRKVLKAISAWIGYNVKLFCKPTPWILRKTPVVLM